MSPSRVIRGRETERIIAKDLRASGAPDAEAIPASLRGRDIKGIPGLALEVKARGRFRPLEWIAQAVRNAEGDIPMVVLRCNGQGPASLDDWPVIMRYGDAKDLLSEANYLASDCH